jgi:hypothetical protein
MPDIKPQVGEVVYFYDPNLTARIGFAEGYGGRGIGPYAAFVVNDRDGGLDLHVLYPAKQPAFVQDKVRFKPEEDALAKEAVPKPYWDWKDASQKARAAKRAAE